MSAVLQETSLNAVFEAKTRDFLVRLLRLDEDIDLRVDEDLIRQIGLDSIEAFDAVASMHELLDVVIPDTFDPKVANSIRALSAYVIDTFGAEVAQRFLDVDLNDPALFDEDEDF